MRLIRLLVFTALALPIANTARPKSEASLPVRVYDLADVPANTLLQAEATAALIFDQAGVELRWIHCVISGQDFTDCPDCAQATDPPARIIKILPKAMSDRFGFPAAKFGFALAPSQAYVFFGRLQLLTTDSGFSRSKILGHIMAHELGHLLLGAESHASAGIMNDQLSVKDCGRPGIMVLAFSRQQAARMRSHLRNSAVAATSHLRTGS